MRNFPYFIENDGIRFEFYQMIILEDYVKNVEGQLKELNFNKNKKEYDTGVGQPGITSKHFGEETKRKVDDALVKGTKGNLNIESIKVRYPENN